MKIDSESEEMSQSSGSPSSVILGKHFGSLGLSLLIYQIVGVGVGDDVDEDID